MKLFFWISQHLRMHRNTVVDMVRKVAANVFIPFTVGGGIRTVDDFRCAFAGRSRQDFHQFFCDKPPGTDSMKQP